MHTEAERIHRILTERSMANFTLYGGYGMTYGGERITFPTGSIRNEKRIKSGQHKDRVIYSECHYEDGSYLIYRYSIVTGNWSLTAYQKRVES